MPAARLRRCSSRPPDSPTTPVVVRDDDTSRVEFQSSGRARARRRRRHIPPPRVSYERTKTDIPSPRRRTQKLRRRKNAVAKNNLEPDRVRRFRVLEREDRTELVPARARGPGADRSDLHRAHIARSNTTLLESVESQP